MNRGWLKKISTWDAEWTARLVIADQPGFVRSLAIFFAHSGDSWLWLAGLVLVWIFGNGEWKWRAVVFITGILFTALTVFAIKFTVRRQRPEGEWGAIYRKTDPHSFPSGHAARATLLAVLAIGLGPVWFALLLLVWAPLVVLARVAMGVHYLSDVLAGAVLGIATGLLTLSLSSWLMKIAAPLL